MVGLFYLEAMMTKIYAQKPEYLLLSTSTALGATGSMSGSLISLGHSKLIGTFYSSMSATIGAGSGINIFQSADYGQNWDMLSASYPIKAITASPFSIDIVGNAVKVQIWTGASAASIVRAAFYLRPF
jgi:hypothetical protein